MLGKLVFLENSIGVSKSVNMNTSVHYTNLHCMNGVFLLLCCESVRQYIH